MATQLRGALTPVSTSEQLPQRSSKRLGNAIDSRGHLAAQHHVLDVEFVTELGQGHEGAALDPVVAGELSASDGEQVVA
ncbi:hypothetical protein [Plesiocystis pacifica]|uniref:hypothetical protein n=1 Tax=Plesiocystis pacifica TaxID=191768 RepID=UPI001E4C6CA6|nr:hypothetical protein [Plesiocystis pacifica]